VHRRQNIATATKHGRGQLNGVTERRAIAAVISTTDSAASTRVRHYVLKPLKRCRRRCSSSHVGHLAAAAVSAHNAGILTEVICCPCRNREEIGKTISCSIARSWAHKEECGCRRVLGEVDA